MLKSPSRLNVPPYPESSNFPRLSWWPRPPGRSPPGPATLPTSSAVGHANPLLIQSQPKSRVTTWSIFSMWSTKVIHRRTGASSSKGSGNFPLRYFANSETATGMVRSVRHLRSALIPISRDTGSLSVTNSPTEARGKGGLLRKKWTSDKCRPRQCEFNRPQTQTRKRQTRCLAVSYL